MIWNFNWEPKSCTKESTYDFALTKFFNVFAIVRLNTLFLFVVEILGHLHVSSSYTHFWQHPVLTFNKQLPEMMLCVKGIVKRDGYF